MSNQEQAVVPDSLAITRSIDEPEAFAELFERHFSLVYRFLSLRAGEQAAGDLAAETFAIAFRRRADYDAARADARPWLLGIATNLARDLQRSERRRRATVTRLGREPSALQDGVASAMNAGPNSDALRAALAELGPQDRDLLLLFGCIGLSYAEIGEALSLPLGTVRSRIHRLRHKLRGRLSLQSEEASADVR